jgi:hypothetical protein
MNFYQLKPKKEKPKALKKQNPKHPQPPKGMKTFLSL